MAKIKVYIIIIISFLLFSCCIYRHDGISYLSFKFHKHKTYFIELENQFLYNKIDSINDFYQLYGGRGAFEQATGIAVLQISFNSSSEKNKCNRIDIVTGSKLSSGYIYYSDDNILDTVIYYAEQLSSVDSSIDVEVDKLSEHWMCYNCNKEVPIAILIRNNFNWSD